MSACWTWLPFIAGALVGTVLFWALALVEQLRHEAEADGRDHWRR